MGPFGTTDEGLSTSHQDIRLPDLRQTVTFGVPLSKIKFYPSGDIENFYRFVTLLVLHHPTDNDLTRSSPTNPLRTYFVLQPDPYRFTFVFPLNGYSTDTVLQAGRCIHTIQFQLYTRSSRFEAW